MRTSRETIEKRFLIFICRKAVEMIGLQFCALTGLVILTANLLKYLHLLKIEGVIVTRHIIEELTEKMICMHWALSVLR